MATALPRVARALAVPLAIAAAVTAAAPGWVTVRVRSGDTLSAIAARSHTTVAELVALNHLAGNGDLIYAGQTLKVGRSAGAARTASTTVRHRVVEGDSLYGLAARYHADWRQIARLNHLPPSLVVQLGQVLVIPARAAGSASGGPASGGSAPAAAPAGSGISRAAMRDLIARTARAYGVDPALALAVAYQESGCNQRMVSATGAIGAMQVMPSTGTFVGRYVVGRPLDLRSPRDNAVAGVALLKTLLRVVSPKTAVAAYYQGLASVRSRGMYADTEQYVRNVMALRVRFHARGF